VLKLRRGTVVEATLPGDGFQRLVCEVGGVQRPAQADPALVGPCEPGDDVVLNTEALDLGLGSGGFDIVHVNLTRGLGGSGIEGAHVMKLNYTSLQHAVLPVEGEELVVPLARPVAVFGLHGQLAPLAWGLAQARPGAKLGYVQTAGGALPGTLSEVVRDLREHDLLAGHLTAGAAFGGEAEAITTVGAIHHGLRDLGWDACVCGPGPGILGSGSVLGHGGIVALDSAHAAIALGCPTVVVARMSSGDPRPRHQGISHHTLTVLGLMLEPVFVPIPEGVDPELPDDYRHHIRTYAIDLDGYEASGLPARTMGRALREDPEFFGAALAAGVAVADMVR
jgi:hypothetical protein